MRRFLTLCLLACLVGAAGAGALAALDACVPADTRPAPGSLTLTVSPSPAVTNGVVTADGWAITFDRVLVAIGRARLSGSNDACINYSEADYDRVLDVTSKANQKLSILHALGGCGLRFRVGPPSSDAVLGEGVLEEQKALLRTPGADPYVRRGGIGIDVAGTARRGNVTKRFQLLFRPRVFYTGCELAPDAGTTIVLESNVDLVYDIRIEAEAMLRDDVDAQAASLRFEPFAAADKDGDGLVTLDELRQVPIAAVRDAGAFEAGTYELDDDGGVLFSGRPVYIATLGDYVYELLMPTFPRFRGVGSCFVGLGQFRNTGGGDGGPL